jgi:uncharacterized surface protein with fasciclin (FAS1) repeats
MRKLLSGLAAVALALAVAAPAMAAPLAPKSGSTIVDIVVANDGEFDVLQAAVIRAGVAGALSDPDAQYTVFAPTDAAFVTTFRSLLLDSGLTEADVIAFINAGGVDSAFGDGALANILLFHVTDGRRTSKSVLAAPGYTMLNGERLTRVQLVDAGISAVNVGASNGIIHVIDSVLLP